MRRLLSLTLAGVGLFAPAVYAQLPGLVSTPLAGGGQSWSLPVQTLVFITSLTFIPAILLMMTSFTRIIIVFGLLRNALGTPTPARCRDRKRCQCVFFCLPMSQAS